MDPPPDIAHRTLVASALMAHAQLQQKPTAQGCAKFPGYFFQTMVARTHLANAHQSFFLSRQRKIVMNHHDLRE
ncbi:hypothetical protein [Xanthomonas bromi]|uniref:hypothetical protein n=1 Tax=Xanthomonas bromi TaxID=56449 RepID=UPI001CA494DE|nr:hypothetical protein [Xanthomonas bromi]